MPSTVKDLTTYIPMNNTTEFCLDTNVLYWYTYPRYMISSKRGTQEHAQSYYDFVDRLVENGNPLLTTRYNITELINIVEKHEYDIFALCIQRHNIPERIFDGSLKKEKN